MTLLKDYFGPEADSDVDGIPVPLGKAIRIPYAAYGPYGPERWALERDDFIIAQRATQVAGAQAEAPAPDPEPEAPSDESNE